MPGLRNGVRRSGTAWQQCHSRRRNACRAAAKYPARGKRHSTITAGSFRAMPTNVVANGSLSRSLTATADSKDGLLAFFARPRPRRDPGVVGVQELEPRRLICRPRALATTVLAWDARWRLSPAGRAPGLCTRRRGERGSRRLSARHSRKLARALTQPT
jgi:hypothetical protein